MRAINRIINTEIMFFILIFVFAFQEISQYGRIPRIIVTVLPLLVIIDNLIDPDALVHYVRKRGDEFAYIYGCDPIGIVK